MSIIGLLRVDLVLRSAGGVTAPELDAAAVDLPLSRRRGRPAAGGTTDDEVWVPPTSLAGSLRAHVGDQAAERWFGSAPPVAATKADERLEPSRVRFLGSQTTLPRSPAVRRSTAVDPRRGSALASTLRSREVAPAGTTVSLFLRMDQTPGTDDLDEFAHAVSTWHPVIGRGRSTGHGRARVTRVAWRRLDLRTTAGLRLWLTAGRDGLFPATDGWDQVHTPPAPADPEPELDLRWRLTGALHLGSGTTTSDDGHTRSKVEQDAGEPLLPGTTWKGLLRSRCGYILRSCGRTACLAPAEPGCCGDCMLCDLFGWTGEGGRAGDPIGHAGRLTTHDSAIDGTVTHRNHVGLDRFTGGARRALLFSDEIVAEGSLSLRVDAADTGCTPPARLAPAERGLLLLAVRDLHDGLIGVGRATTRGYGSLRLTPDSAAVLDELAPSHPTGAAVLALLQGKDT